MSSDLSSLDGLMRDARVRAGFAVLVASLVAIAYCHRPGPTSLPPKLETAVVHHEIQTVVDSVALQQSRADAAAIQATSDSNAARARRSETRARAYKAAAESLAMEAVKAKTAADSAARFQAAYVARSREADSLTAANRSLDSARAGAIARGDTLAVALTRSEIGRRSADSLVTALVGAAQRSPTPCRVAWFIPCPSRKAAAIAAAAAGAGVAIAVTNHAKIPLPGLTIQLARIPIR